MRCYTCSNPADNGLRGYCHGCASDLAASEAYVRRPGVVYDDEGYVCACRGTGCRRCER